ncbi:MAG: class I SAM-dependent methyltransferase, partial [Anaerolineae bacterium]|nr:class I SAM-dependent methyltransferase [Anaerolineae bacterium]
MSDSVTPTTPRSSSPPSPEQLVQSVKARLGHVDPEVEAALLSVPRAHFLPNLSPELVYSDAAFPLKRAMDGTVTSSASQPTCVAMMLQQLQLRPGDNVLEIGAGSGYSA